MWGRVRSSDPWARRAYPSCRLPLQISASPGRRSSTCPPSPEQVSVRPGLHGHRPPPCSLRHPPSWLRAGEVRLGVRDLEGDSGSGRSLGGRWGPHPSHSHGDRGPLLVQLCPPPLDSTNRRWGCRLTRKARLCGESTLELHRKAPWCVDFRIRGAQPCGSTSPCRGLGGGDWSVTGSGRALGVPRLAQGPHERFQRESIGFTQKFEPPGELREQRRRVTEMGENSHACLKVQPALMVCGWGAPRVGSPAPGGAPVCVSTASWRGFVESASKVW